MRSCIGRTSRISEGIQTRSDPAIRFAQSTSRPSGPGDQPKFVAIARQPLQGHQGDLLRAAEFQFRDDVDDFRLHARFSPGIHYSCITKDIAKPFCRQYNNGPRNASLRRKG